MSADDELAPPMHSLVFRPGDWIKMKMGARNPPSSSHCAPPFNGHSPPIVVVGDSDSGTRVVRGLLVDLGVSMAADFQTTPHGAHDYQRHFHEAPASSGCKKYGPGIDFLNTYLATARTTDVSLDSLNTSLVQCAIEGISPSLEFALECGATGSASNPCHGFTQRRQLSTLSTAAERNSTNHENKLEGTSLKQPWGFKNPRALNILPPLVRSLGGPGCLKVVHVIRDGRDSAFAGNPFQASLLGQALLHGVATPGMTHMSPQNAAAFWGKSNLGVARWARRELDQDSYFLVHIEDLVGKNGRSTMLDEAKRLHTFVHGSAPTGEAMGVIERTLDKMSSDHYGGYHWKDKPKRELCALERHIADAQAVFGYHKSGACTTHQESKRTG